MLTVTWSPAGDKTDGGHYNAYGDGELLSVTEALVLAWIPSTGAMATGWTQIGDTWYLFPTPAPCSPAGSM